jgi:ligand-binding sensor domain-containing protein
VISDFIMDEHQVWISCLQTGLVVFDRKSGKVKRYIATTGPGFTSIQALATDREKNIWAGSKINLMRTQGDHLEFIATPELKDKNIIAVAVDHKGNEWFSTGEGLFSRSVDEAGKITLQRPLANSKFQKFTVISLFVDVDGYVWAGLYGEGVIRINPSTGATRHLTKEIRNGNILNIAGKGNVVWLATLGGGTQIKISGEQLVIKNFTSADGLISDYIYQIFIDSQDRVWFATDGKGVDMMDNAGFHHYQEGLNSKVVYGFAEDGDHRIWVNVQGDGLYHFEGGRFKSFNLKGIRLRDNNIGSFTSTSSGNLFIIHDLGIDIYDIKRDKVEYHGEEVGVHDMKPNLNSLAKDGLGQILVGTDNGIIRYTDFSNSKTIEPTPFIEGFNVLNHPVKIPGNLVFPYDQNGVTIKYRGLWFQNPTALGYQYRLKNFDKEWIASRDQSVTYSSLPPGEYEFELKISDNDGFAGAKGTGIKFVIRPPFWQTLWFYALATIGVLFTIYIIITFRERKLQKDKHLLEASVKERTLEIFKKNEEIHAQAEEIRAINENLEELVKERTSQLERKNKALEEYAFINAHELRAPVASILGLISLMETIELDEDQKIYLQHLQTSAQKLDTVVRSIGKAIEKGE